MRSVFHLEAVETMASGQDPKVTQEEKIFPGLEDLEKSGQLPAFPSISVGPNPCLI